MPKLAMIDVPEMNAYASGLNRDQYTVTVTTGLTKKLNDDELETVLAHELTHIRNNDVRLMVIASVIAGSFVFVGEMLFCSFRKSMILIFGSDEDDMIASIVAISLSFVVVVTLWFIAQFVNLALSRAREYLADAGAVELTGKPNAMISALKKVSTDSNLRNAPTSVMQMCLDNPRAGFMELFATHPRVENRINALSKMPQRIQRAIPRTSNGGRVEFGKRSYG